MPTFAIPDIVAGGKRPTGRGQTLACVGRWLLSELVGVAAASTADSNVLDCGGFATFNLFLDVTGVGLSLTWIPYASDIGAMAAQTVTALPTGTGQLITFGFRGQYLDDHVFHFGFLRFTNSDGAIAATIANAVLYATTL